MFRGPHAHSTRALRESLGSPRADDSVTIELALDQPLHHSPVSSSFSRRRENGHTHDEVTLWFPDTTCPTLRSTVGDPRSCRRDDAAAARDVRPTCCRLLPSNAASFLVTALPSPSRSPRRGGPTATLISARRRRQRLASHVWYGRLIRTASSATYRYTVLLCSDSGRRNSVVRRRPSTTIGDRRAPSRLDQIEQPRPTGCDLQCWRCVGDRRS